MHAGNYLALAGLIVLMLPIVVLHQEGRRSPDIFYALLVLCGLGTSAWAGGWSGFAWSLAAAAAVLAVTGGLVTLLRSRMRLRLLTGGQIKLMAAGATWLGPWGSLLMLLIALLTLLGIAIGRQLTHGPARPTSANIIVAAIMVVALQQHALML